jgi:hypothetical protein
MIETMNVGDGIEDGMFSTGLHEKAYETSINVEVSHKDALVGLTAQFEREVTGKGGHAYASLGAHHSDHGSLTRVTVFRGSSTGPSNSVPQGLHQKRTVTDALHDVVVFGALLYPPSASDSVSFPLRMRMGILAACIFVAVNVSRPWLSGSPRSSSIASMFPFLRRFNPVANELVQLTTNSMSPFGEPSLNQCGVFRVIFDQHHGDSLFDHASLLDPLRNSPH